MSDKTEVNHTYPALCQKRAIQPAVMVVLDDEPCMYLREINLNSKGFKGFHRYQVLRVVRNDELAEAWHDMGPVECWPGIEQFNIVGGATVGRLTYIEHTVAEMKEMADQLRGKKLFDKKELVGMDNIRDAS